MKVYAPGVKNLPRRIERGGDEGRRRIRAMPELPEVESVRRGLWPALGQRVRSVALRRPDVVEGERSAEALLRGCRITALRRHGKELMLCGGDDDQGRCVCVHLGMTGSLRYLAAGERDAHDADGHLHVEWTLDDGSRLRFRDPRRFGGVWTFANPPAARCARWDRLGPDALVVTGEALHQALRATSRALKAALLDQRVVAGLGNIYVDELLFLCGWSPSKVARTLKAAEVDELAARMRELLTRAIEAGGSTVRDYVDGRGQAGGYQDQHQVYGRGGRPCVRCGGLLRVTTVGGRTTVHCPACQVRRRPMGTG